MAQYLGLKIAPYGHFRRSSFPIHFEARTLLWSDDRRVDSGRLARCIPIAEFRDRAYRVTKPLLKEWGGITVNDGYLQRSARLPEFNDAARFYKWFQRQKPKLLPRNN